ncbi:MAG: 4a-hydroxytetrahydrobiopterin dehydratase [Bacteroidota bacterium]|nr:4a-hydroxytetrahydrobiopterin dehydratase [Bacteroidota bacterium]MDX5430254.1 4a-hydroxytetrahydrobiopterin dehydratase [Bacteroidota bacterium]MDX5469015.1 4a-hydroxytetrahydrobiopterin dehydratase [Bacteroidota bacterium]
MWKEENNALHRTYEFKTFVAAIAFMVNAAMHIDQMNHHPEWTNVYNRVSVRLTTHDAGNTVTDKDRQLAELLDRIYEEVNSK